MIRSSTNHWHSPKTCRSVLVSTIPSLPRAFDPLPTDFLDVSRVF